MINPVDMLFLYKPDFKFQKAEIEKKVCLPAGELEEFLRNPLEGLPHTIVELDGTTLTAAGKEAWADVLDVKVVRVFQGYSGLQMELSDVKASRLDAFSAMLAGYCSGDIRPEGSDPAAPERHAGVQRYVGV